MTSQLPASKEMIRRSLFLEQEKTKLANEKEKIIKKFQKDFIYDKYTGKVRPTCQVKYYGEGAKYEGMFVDVSPHPRTNLPPSHHLTPP